MKNIGEIKPEYLREKGEVGLVLVHILVLLGGRRMQSLHLPSSTLSILAFCVTLLPFVAGFSHEDVKSRKSIKNNIHKMNPKMASDIALHGVLSWVFMGFLLPLGVLSIRMSHREEGGRRKVLFYLHVILQMLSVLLATAGAIMSLKSFENSFDNNHQRIGLALYCAIWVQAVIGFLRPRRGNKRRSTWYFVHWILGTIISLVGIINIYTGLNAYHKKTSRNPRLWTILFTAQVSFMGFFYLFQDKWAYMQKQGVILGNVEQITPTNQLIAQSDNQKALVPEPCGKRNALKNLFD